MKPTRKYYSIIDKVYDRKNLEEAWKKVKANKGSAGIDGETINWFEMNRNQNLYEIQRFLREKRYHPTPSLRKYISKSNGKQRPLGIPIIRDRIVQQAVRQMIEPLFDRGFYPHSYGFRKGHSQHQALETIKKAKRAGYEYVVDLDIQAYFDTIPHSKLMRKVKEKIADGRVLDLLEGWLKAGIMEDGQFHETEEGSPQGGVISPLLANIYLDDFDWKMREAGYPVVRFADDAVIMCKTERQSHKAYQLAREILEDELNLTMHPEKTKVVDFDEGFHFLGFDFWKDYLLLPEKRMRKVKKDIRYLTRRHQGKNVREVIKRLNQTIRGFGNYFGIGNTKEKFKKLDSWIRMRLRAYIRKKKSTVSNRLIPTYIFDRLGLVSLVDLLTNRS
ncbi:group II intron reverse transcriptase/maturase [Pseudalkalibacillus caeni]|uniref:Group II intron reverse transcriptase/maturase n=1 Tax=Exobacillus caeni TaxID=2574798 RepID=A0A5R9EW78_9BACL|nr:group II intron reverse transcriptase/maturase [Pseudalkalibacillus caeni]TLS34889.1 group II intron reverse transcriptase/maturase [Pseudalkalibacillus caeni]